MEWKTNPPTSSRPHDRDRCIPHGMGCGGQWGEHRGPVVEDKTLAAYQLPGDDGGSSAEAHPAKDRQLGSDFLCQSLVGNEFPLTVTYSMPAMRVGLPKRNNSLCRTSARFSKCDCRPGV